MQAAGCERAPAAGTPVAGRMGVSILLQGPGDGGLQVETAAGASLGSVA